MLTCIARSKQSSNDNTSSIDPPPLEKLNSAAPPSKQAIKILSSQIKDMALKASGAYRQCAPCAAETIRRSGSCGGGESGPERYRWSYRRAGSSVSSSSSAAGRRELEARLKGISSGEGTPASASGRRVDPVVFVEESEPKEWVAQVEPGVLITFLSLPRGGNDLKQIKFSWDSELIEDVGVQSRRNPGKHGEKWPQEKSGRLELSSSIAARRAPIPVPTKNVKEISNSGVGIADFLVDLVPEMDRGGAGDTAGCSAAVNSQ